MGIEAGGIFASATNDDALAINFQITGGNIWAECTAFGAVGDDGQLELIDLTVANMDAAMLGEVSLKINPAWMASGPSPATVDVAPSEALNTTEMKGSVVPTARSAVPRMSMRTAASTRPALRRPSRSRSSPPEMAMSEPELSAAMLPAMLLADEEGKWISEAFDSLAAAAIPFLLAGLLYVFYRLAKLFASAF